MQLFSINRIKGTILSSFFKYKIMERVNIDLLYHSVYILNLTF